MADKKIVEVRKSAVKIGATLEYGYTPRFSMVLRIPAEVVIGSEV